MSARRMSLAMWLIVVLPVLLAGTARADYLDPNDDFDDGVLDVDRWDMSGTWGAAWYEETDGKLYMNSGLSSGCDVWADNQYAYQFTGDFRVEAEVIQVTHGVYPSGGIHAWCGTERCTAGDILGVEYNTLATGTLKQCAVERVGNVATSYIRDWEETRGAWGDWAVDEVNANFGTGEIVIMLCGSDDASSSYSETWWDNFTLVPEPGTLAMFGIGAIVMLTQRYRRQA